MTRQVLARRHAAGAASVRGLLFTVLGEFVLPDRGWAWTSAFIDLFARLAVEEMAIRQALARTSADGWITPERHGRRTLWRLTPDGDRLLREGSERIYAFAGAQPEWDGSWLMVLARAPGGAGPVTPSSAGPGPAGSRSARHRLRTRLSWAGLGSLAPGLWVTTHTERTREIEQVLREVGVGDWQVFVAEHRGGAEPTALVRQAWDLAAIGQRYQRFLAEFESPSTADPLARLTELVHAWRRFPAIDPGLPIALLPTGWSGARAARMFAARHAAWAPEAAAQWSLLNADGALPRSPDRLGWAGPFVPGVPDPGSDIVR